MENSALKSLPLRFTFRSKLFLGLGAIGLLILTLLALANRVIQEAFHHLQETRTQHLGPLVDINNLQTQINRIYSLEIELTRSLDYFAVTTQLETLSSESQLFTKQLSHFLDGHQARDTLDMQRLGLYWKGYQADLQRIQKHAARMETEQVLHISTYESFPRFTNITRTLQRIANDTETEASKIFDHAIDHHHQLRRTFLVAAAIGFAFYVAYMFFFLRSLSHRLSRLTDGAARLSEGRAEQPIEVQGNDELTELAIAFNAMQQEVAFRENALREAGGQLEHRVNLRTHELQETNKRLSNEVEERRRAEQALRLLSLAVEQSPVSVMITDTRGRIEYVNNAFVKISGYSPKEAVGETPALLKSGLTSRETYRDLWSTIARGSDWEGELHNRKRDGSLYWEHARISPVKNVDGEITHYLSVQEDVTLRREHEAKIAFQAQYDALTELPNRALAIDRLSQTIHHAVRTSCRVALMFIDLDDFKKINDSLGHEIGDELLVQASKRLRQAVRKEDTVARHGGDEFLVIMGDLSDVSDSKNLVSKILNAFAPPFTVSGYDLVVTPSIGLAVFPDDGGIPTHCFEMPISRCIRQKVWEEIPFSFSLRKSMTIRSDDWRWSAICVAP